MRYILTLLIFYSMTSYGQYEGEYCLSTNVTHRCIIMEKGNRFSYEYFDCTNLMNGMGWYEFLPQKLILHFDDDIVRKYLDTGKVEINKVDPLDKSVCKIEFTLTEKDSQPIIGASIIDRYSNTKTTSDTNGYAVLALPRFQENSIIEISCIGMNTIIIPISNLMDYRLNVVLTYKKHIVPSGEVYTLKIRHKTHKAFDLVPNNRFEKYHKLRYKQK